MVDASYMRSWAGLFKIGQFVFLVVAFSFLAHFIVEAENSKGFTFFLIVSIASSIIVMFVYGYFAICGHRLHSSNWTVMMIVLSGVEALLLVIASSVVAENARELRHGLSFSHEKYQSPCEHYGDHHAPCRDVEAAVVFGFMSAVLFVADVVFYFINYRSVIKSQNGIDLDKGAPSTLYNADHVDVL